MLKKRLRIIWDNYPPSRYVPRALPDRKPGNFGWDVFDRKEDRFLTRREIKSLSLEDCRERLVN